MDARPPWDQALGFFKGELEQHGRPLEDLTLGRAWSAFQRFGQQRFDTPSTPESDGLLFQYGTHSFYGPPRFLVSLTRQFEVNDHDGEHDHFVHICCELRYRPNPALERLGSFNRWFFHDTRHQHHRPQAARPRLPRKRRLRLAPGHHPGRPHRHPPEPARRQDPHRHHHHPRRHRSQPRLSPPAPEYVTATNFRGPPWVRSSEGPAGGPTRTPPLRVVPGPTGSTRSKLAPTMTRRRGCLILCVWPVRWCLVVPTAG